MAAEAADPRPTWDAWGPLIRPHLSPLLIDHAAFGWFEGVARHLPSDCLGILELRLAAGSTAVDFAVRLARADQARAVAASLASDHTRRFLERWARRSAGLGAVSALWLEFDSDSRRSRRAGDGVLPEPLLCARLDGANDPAWVAGTLLGALCGEPLSASQRRAVVRCLAALPAPARLLYVFSLRGRRNGGVRLEIYGLEPPSMTAYLRRAVSPAAAERVAAVADLVAGADRFHLSFDVAEEVSPRLGVEWGLRRQPAREPRWAELLDRLVARGLASPGKRDALFAWPGQDSLWSAPARWPAPAVGGGGHAARGLSHVKLVLRPGRTPEAKAYLSFRYVTARPPAAASSMSPPAASRRA